MAHTSEYEIEDIFIDRLEGIGYKFIKLNNYDEVLANFREQLAKFNAKKLEEKGHTASFSDSEFNRIMIHVDNHSVYESAKVLRDKYDLQLDNGESVYIEFFSGDTDRNIYQVTHQVTMDKAHKDDVVYKNRYDVTVLITGSGKTLTSFKLAQILRDEPMVDLVVFLIDRKDLDDQTIDEYNSFEKDCVDRTNSTAVLINMLKSSEKKMIVTTIQKMANAVKNPKYAAVMDAYKDKKVVFIIDECHRSQLFNSFSIHNFYGFILRSHLYIIYRFYILTS